MCNIHFTTYLYLSIQWLYKHIFSKRSSQKQPIIDARVPNVNIL